MENPPDSGNCINSSHCHLVVGQLRDGGQGNGEAPKTLHKNVPLYHPDDGWSGPVTMYRALPAMWGSFIGQGSQLYIVADCCLWFKCCSRTYFSTSLVSYWAGHSWRINTNNNFMGRLPWNYALRQTARRHFPVMSFSTSQFVLDEPHILGQSRISAL